MGPKHHAKFQKKTKEPILRKLIDRRKDARKDGWKDGRKDGWKDGWKDEWKDGQTLFYRTLLVEARGSIKVMTS